MLIPTAALLQEENNCYVLVREAENKFRRTEVTVASAEGDKTVVLSGIRPGQEIISEGAFYLLDAR